MSDVVPARRELLAKFENTELLTRYPRSIDRGDIAALRACYAPIYDGIRTLSELSEVAR